MLTGNVFERTQNGYCLTGFRFKKFGAHLGFRYFFTQGFGVFTEAGIPIKLQTNPIGFDKPNNQFTSMERLSISKTKLFFE
jgi:hypothetical protein